MKVRCVLDSSFNVDYFRHLNFSIWSIQTTSTAKNGRLFNFEHFCFTGTAASTTQHCAVSACITAYNLQQLMQSSSLAHLSPMRHSLAPSLILIMHCTGSCWLQLCYQYSNCTELNGHPFFDFRRGLN